MKKKAIVARTLDPVDMAVGERIKKLREASDPRLTQTWLAREIGLTAQQVQKYERGVDRIHVSRLFAIAAALDVTVVDLLGPLATKKR